MAERLGIHIIGRGFGECIVVEMPQGQIGVVDCFSPKLSIPANTSAARRRANPLLRFLRESLGAETLAIVAWTHPHEDHSRGFSHLLAEYQGKIDLLWVFETWQELYLERYFSAWMQRGRLPIEELLGEEPGTFALELLRIREQLCQQLFEVKPPSRLETFAGRKSHVLASTGVTWHALAPSQKAVARYRRELIDNLTDFVDDEGQIINAKWRPEAIDHNQISGGFLLEYGHTRVLLGGDIVAAGWQDFLDSRNEAPLDLACQYVKASHHGSSTGYVAGLYEEFSRLGPPTVVLTPFNRHVSPLPHHEGVSHIRGHSAELRATCKRAVDVSLALSSPNPVALPPKWISMIEERPELATLLRADYATASDDSPAVRTVPRRWLKDIEREPRLRSVLKGSVALNNLDADDEHRYRISYWFDRDGRKVDEYHGEDTGLIE